MDQQQLGQMLLCLPIFLFSVIVHEIAHGLVALWRGDPTAKSAGRPTPNPVPHVDLVGSLWPRFLAPAAGMPGARP